MDEVRQSKWTRARAVKRVLETIEEEPEKKLRTELTDEIKELKQQHLMQTLACAIADPMYEWGRHETEHWKKKFDAAQEGNVTLRAELNAQVESKNYWKTECQQVQTILAMVQTDHEAVSQRARSWKDAYERMKGYAKYLEVQINKERVDANKRTMPARMWRASYPACMEQFVTNDDGVTYHTTDGFDWAEVLSEEEEGLDWESDTTLGSSPEYIH